METGGRTDKVRMVLEPVAAFSLDRFEIIPGMVLHSALADGCGTLCSPDRTFVVMPIRVDTKEDRATGTDAIAPFRSLIHLQDLQADGRYTCGCTPGECLHTPAAAA